MQTDDSQALLPGVRAEDLFPTAPPTLPPAQPRLRLVDRDQHVLRTCSLQDLLEEDHPARIVWDLVQRWDLSAFLLPLRARGPSAGRPATDPGILIALWLFAHTQGVGCGRELARRCEAHDAYRWICGGVSLNYHTLNDFRVQHEEAIDGLLTQMLAALTFKGLVSVKTIAQDGTRQRAGAGRNSFKTRPTLEQHLQEAQAHVQELKRQAQDPAASAQKKAAARRAARERVERLEQAIQEVGKVEAAKAAQKAKPSKNRPAKASETDPQARQMRMPNGGTAPGYNIQFAVAVADGDAPGRAIVGVDVTNAGSDVHESRGMREQVRERTGRKIQNHLMDGGYIGLEQIDVAAQEGVRVYAPVPKPRKKGSDPHQPRKGDSEAVAEWRGRMGGAEAKAFYRRRASTCETANGECKSYRGLGPMLVRGLRKARCVALWAALAYNLAHFGVRLVG